MDAREFYDVLGDDYDLMVSWEERLRREEAFFRRVFDEACVRRVLDAACGTGMHAVAFSRWGLTSAGADASPVMIARARENARSAGVDVDFRVAGFGGMAAAFQGPFDAITCVGNSLPHLVHDAALGACLSDFASLIRPGGILVIQNRNYDRLLRERQRFMPLAARTDGEGETLFLRITDFPGPSSASEESIDFTIVTLRRRGGKWSQSVRSTPLRALRRASLEKALAEAGFSSVQVYGGYSLKPYDAPDAKDLVAIAVRSPNTVR